MSKLILQKEQFMISKYNVNKRNKVNKINSMLICLRIKRAGDITALYAYTKTKRKTRNNLTLW